MSAFLVEDKTINRVVTYLKATRFRGDHSYTLSQLEELGFNVEDSNFEQKLGEAMFILNIGGVSERYGNAQGFRPLDYKYSYEMNTKKIQVLKSLRCFLYQCNEGENDKLDLFKVLTSLSHGLAYQIVSDMPEYDNAIWG